MSKGMFRRARNMNASLGLVELLLVICKVSLKVGSGYSKVSRSTTSCSFINTIITKATPSNRYPPDLHLQREYPCALFFMAAPALASSPKLPPYISPRPALPYYPILPYPTLPSPRWGWRYPSSALPNKISRLRWFGYLSFTNSSFNHGTNMPTLM